jgi:8-oxo-dGTP pyrophosphatase MutT (NUDIX family)
MTELWDVYDESGGKTGLVAERDRMLRGEVPGFFLVVNVYIVNSKNEWLIQKRSMKKATHPGTWSITGGGVLSGEDTLAAALREAKEEVGIDLDPSQMYLEARLKRARSFNDVWVARADFNINECTPDPEEVDELRWVTPEELIRMVFADGSFDPDYRAAIENLLERGPAAELWDVLDRNGGKTGRVVARDRIWRGGTDTFHLVVHVYMVNTKNEWLIQKRSMSKHLWPGRWDITGGAVLSGEDSLSAALREVREEIGISLDPSLMYIEKRLQWPNVFADIWVARADFDIGDCTLEPTEVDDVRWVNANDFMKIVFDGSKESEYRSLVDGFVSRRILWVVPYDPSWKTEFDQMRATLLPQLGDLIIDIVHTGSTSVPGLAAKPILDYFLVMESADDFPAVAARLRTLGYEHEGDGGIPGRERFRPMLNNGF